MNSLQEIARELLKPGPLVITTHIMPDGDSIGSLLGLGLALSRLREDVTMFSADTVPDRYSFLRGSKSIVTGSLPDAPYVKTVVLDCSDHLRIRPVWELVRETFIINIDHHTTNQYFGKMNYVDTAASATGEIIYDLLAILGIEPDTAIASALYVAIATDTGSFKFESTTPKTHIIASRLLEKGVSLREITPMIFDLRSRAAVHILQAALASLQFSADGNIAWMVLTEDDMKKSNAKEEHLEGVVNFARNIEGVEVGLIFRAKEDGTVKVGFRSQNADVAKVAQSLGGGGHPRAAGCSLEGTLDEALSKVLEAVKRVL